VLLMDEPSMGLSPLMVDKIFEVVRDVYAQGVTVLLVEQNASRALSIANRGYVMESGLITMTGDAKTMLNDPKVRAAYRWGCAYEVQVSKSRKSRVAVLPQLPARIVAALEALTASSSASHSTEIQLAPTRWLHAWTLCSWGSTSCRRSPMATSCFVSSSMIRDS
jgi:ABC-type multidrug transport system ATPase subunit